VTPPSSTDGRVARGERTRAKIVAAFLDLLTDGDPRPTARGIAERAGVSVRSIFQHFDDMEALRADVVSLQGERIRPMIDDVDPDGPLPRRIASLVAQRRALYEFVAPVRRSMAGVERSGAIDRGLGALHRQLRDQVATQFATELATTSPEEATTVLDAIDVICSFEAWDQLRSTQGLPPEDAAAALTLAVGRLLSPT
jgi:TetR/AcrR family transcriptional regulator, regulator of autoinduction and epiphytic fitness